MKVAVTGATGFVGSNLCKYLVAHGHDVVAVVRSPQKTGDLVSHRIELRTADVADASSLGDAFQGVDVVINLAALFNHPDLAREEYERVNVQGVKNVLECAMRTGTSRVLHCSTVGVAVGGSPPYSETTPYSPPAWDKYETTKCDGEKAALDFYNKHKLPVVVIRPAQVYGPGDISKVKFYRMVKKGVIVNPGRTLKHLVYIDDLCRAFELAMKNDAVVGKPIIIAGREVTPLKDLIKLVADELGVPEPKLVLPAWPITLAAAIIEKLFLLMNRKPPVFRRSMDFFTKSVEFSTDVARETLGFEGRIDVKTGVHLTASWYAERWIHLVGDIGESNNAQTYPYSRTY